MHPTRQFETAVCGGSNLKAPMKLDFLRSLCAQERHAWPEVVLCRVEGETLPVCCLSEAAAGDPFARIGIVTAPSEALTALLRTAPVRARVTALCDSAGEPCDGGAPDVWGFLAEYRCGDPLSGAVRAAIDGAAARGCASPEALTARAEYLLEQAVPEPIILRVFAEMFSLPEYPELVPDPPVRYVQADGFGALTRCLAYRLSGMHLRLVGSKGCLLRFPSFSHVGFKGCQIKTGIGRFGLREILLSLFQKRQGLVSLSLRGKNVLLAHLFSQRRGFTNSRIGVYHGIPSRSGFEERLCRHQRLLDDTDPRVQHIKARASGRHHLRGRLLIVIVAQRRLQRLHGCDRVL